MESITLNSRYLDQMTDDEFFNFCQENPELRIERNKHRKIILMSPTGSLSGYLNSIINAKLFTWNESVRLGKTFDSSTGFTLPDQSVLSPDASWVSNEQWNAISEEDKRRFAPLCPVFVVELKSENDHLKELQKKMLLWIENGCRLAWLICPDSETVFIYRQDQTISKLVSFSQKVLGEDVLPGFELELALLKS